MSQAITNKVMPHTAAKPADAEPALLDAVIEATVAKLDAMSSRYAAAIEQPGIKPLRRSVLIASCIKNLARALTPDLMRMFMNLMRMFMNLMNTELGFMTDRPNKKKDLSASAPVVENIDAAILAAVEAGGRLEMSDWHTCETTHCRAGWAITLAGLPGKILEERYGPGVAGALIYASSRPGRRVPNFVTSNDEAMADLRACAAAK